MFEVNNSVLFVKIFRDENCTKIGNRESLPHAKSTFPVERGIFFFREID